MALKWVVGSWLDGTVSELNELPVTQKGGTQISKNIHAEEEATISVSKRDLPNPAEWKTFLEAGNKMVALVNTNVEWNDPNAILFAGPIIRTNGKVKDVIQVKAAGVKEYLARRVITTIMTGTIPDPTAKVVFKNASYREAILNVIQTAFTGSIGNLTTPQVIQNVPYLTAGENGSEFLNSQFVKYTNAIEELVNNSPQGNEYRFNWAWVDSNKSQIKFTPQVAEDNNPQIKANETLNISLDNENYKLVGYQETATLDGYATRIIAQSVSGDEETKTGSDFQAQTIVATTPKVLWDETFNPHVELDSTQMTNQINSRLNFVSKLQGTAELDVIGDLTEWLTHLGKTVNITGGNNVDTSGYAITVRIVDVSGNANENKIKVTIMPLQARYPKLPKPNKNPNPYNYGSGSGSGSGTGINIGGFDTTLPIVPRPPANWVPPTGGGGVPPVIPPKLPDFNSNPVFEDDKPYLIETNKVENYNDENYDRYYQHKNMMFFMSESQMGGVGEANGYNVENLDDLNDKLNIELDSFGKIDLHYALFNSNNINIPQKFMSLELKNVIGGNWDNFIPKLNTFNSSGYISCFINSYMWVNKNNIYVWVVGAKTFHNNVPQFELQEIYGASFGSKIFVNTLDGTDNSWVDTEWKPKDRDNKLIYPISQDSIIVDNNEIILAGYVYLDDENGSTGKDLSRTPLTYQKRESNTGTFVNHSFCGVYSYAILGINLTTGIRAYYPAVSWTTSTAFLLKDSYEEVTLERTMIWVVDNSQGEKRLAIFLKPTYMQVDSTISFTYWNRYSTSTEIGFTSTKGGNYYSHNFFNNNGMVGSVTDYQVPEAPWNIFKSSSQRTKNNVAQWIKSKNDPNVGGYSFSLTSFSNTHLGSKVHEHFLGEFAYAISAGDPRRRHLVSRIYSYDNNWIVYRYPNIIQAGYYAT